MRGLNESPSNRLRSTRRGRRDYVIKAVTVQWAVICDQSRWLLHLCRHYPPLLSRSGTCAAFSVDAEITHQHVMNRHHVRTRLATCDVRAR